MKLGGILIISTPIKRFVLIHPSHVREYTPEEFLRLLDVSGFELMKVAGLRRRFDDLVDSRGLWSVAAAMKLRLHHLLPIKARRWIANRMNLDGNMRIAEGDWRSAGFQIAVAVKPG